jgi:acyl-CoA reductase-like NAD-dependent aldehyde dehydrogenase
VRAHRRLFIGGEWVEPSGSATVEVVSPATEEVIGVVPEGTFADVDAAAAAARAAFDDGTWASMGAPARAEILGRLLAALHARQDEIARVVTEEVGTPLSVSTHFAVERARFPLTRTCQRRDRRVRRRSRGDTPHGAAGKSVRWQLLGPPTRSSALLRSATGAVRKQLRRRVLRFVRRSDRPRSPRRPMHQGVAPSRK